MPMMNHGLLEIYKSTMMIVVLPIVPLSPRSSLIKSSMIPPFKDGPPPRIDKIINGLKNVQVVPHSLVVKMFGLPVIPDFQRPSMYPRSITTLDYNSPLT